MNFKQFSLDPPIGAGIKAAGYTTPTPIQQQAIPVVLKGRDVLGLAQTGTGKTAAFVLPILQRLTRGPLRRVRVLIVAPTRELAEQIHQDIVDLGKKTKIRSATVYGGVSKRNQVEALRRGAEIVVACPGRLLDLANDGSIDLSRVEVLVLDEADRMCDMGFLPDIRRILKLLPDQRQTLFLSATMPPDIRELADRILDDFDMPDTVDAYTHRIGRTGRIEKTGEAFTFAEPEDEAMVRKIEEVLGTPIERRRLPGFEYHGFVPESQPQQNGRNQLGGTGSNGKHNHVRSNDGKSNGTRAPRRRRPRHRRRTW